MLSKNRAINSVDLYNSEYSEIYRKHDEIVGKSEIFKYFESILVEISNNFKHHINVLDIGCGTGRYFSSIKNSTNLVGIDTSKDMLKYAINKPFKFEEINVKNIELINTDILNLKTNHVFDFIYSIGVLGEHAFFDFNTLRKINSLLKKDGFLFITLQSGESLPMGKKHFIYKYVLNYFPLKIKIFIANKLLNYPHLYKNDIFKLFSSFNFEFEKFITYNTNTESWSGSHYHILVKKIN